MKSFIEKEKIELPLTFGSSQKVDLIVENAHFLGDYEASKNGELVIGTLKINDAALCSLTGDEYFSAEELVRYAIEFAASNQAKEICGQYENAQGIVFDGEHNAELKSTEQYKNAQETIKNMKEDYFKINNILVYMPYLNMFLKYCDKDGSAATLEDLSILNYLTEDDRNSYKAQFSFTYGKEPTNEQLDMFIKFMLGFETDVERVIEICDENENKVPVLGEE